MYREKGKLVHDNPLFSPTEDSQEKCWDSNKETESTKKAAKRMSGHSGSNSGSCEIAVVSPINSLKSSEKASMESSRKALVSSAGSKTRNIVQSMVHNLVDEESQDMEKFSMRIKKFTEQEDEAAGNESGHIPRPLIIQYGGVASYHPIYSPLVPRPSFLGFRGHAPANPKKKGEPTQDIPEMKRSEEEIKENMPQREHSSFGGNKEATETENGPELDLTAAVDYKENTIISPSSFQPAEIDTEGLRSVETDHKMEANCLNGKDTESDLKFRKRTPLIWTVSLVLVFSFSLISAVIPVGSTSLCTNYIVTENSKTNSVNASQSSGLKLTGSKEFYKWFQEPSLAAMKSIFNLDRLKESSRATICKISDFGVLCFRFGFQYFRSVGRCLMMELYEKVKISNSTSNSFVANFKIFWIDMLDRMMNFAEEVPRFCKCFDSERVINKDPRNRWTENHATNVGGFEKSASRAPSNRLGHEIFLHSALLHILGMDICPRKHSMNTCSILEAQGIEEDGGHGDFYNEDRSIPATIQQRDAIDLIQEPGNYTHAKTHHNSLNHDQISADDQDNGKCAGNCISEISLSSPEQTEIEQINFKDMYIELIRSHEFWWLIRASLLVVPSLVLILMILKGLFKSMLKKHGGDHTTEFTEKKESIARYFREMTQRTMESTESPGFGSFIDYADIPVSKEGSRSKAMKTTPVRRSMRIRNKSLSPLQHASTFSNPLQ